MLWFIFICQSIEKKFPPGMYHVLNNTYSQFQRNPFTHSQIIKHLVSVVLAVASSAYS